MKLSFASVAYATILALSATFGDAATSAVGVTYKTGTTAVAAPASSALVIQFTSGDSHTAAADTFKITLPETFDADLTSAAILAAELVMTCTVTTTADTSIALGTDYDGTYDATTRVITLTQKAAASGGTATKLCVAGDVKVTLEKVTIRAPAVAATSVSVGNSKVSSTEAINDNGAFSLVTALDGTLGAPSFVNDTFAIPYTPGAVVTSSTVTVALHKYQFASDSVCSVGGTDKTTTALTAIDDYDFVTFPSAFVAAEQEIKCTKVTRSTNETASKSGGVQVWTGDAKATFKDTAISTHSPTASPTAGPPVASGGACTVSVTTCVTNNTCTVTNATASATVGTCKAAATPTNAPPTAAPVTPTAAGGHSSALSLSSAPLMLAALMVGLGLMN